MIASLPETSGTTRRSPSGVLAGLLAIVRGWHRARRERRELASLSDHMLRDIGLGRADVERELLQPFWQPVDHRTLEESRRRAWRRTAAPGLPR